MSGAQTTDFFAVGKNETCCARDLGIYRNQAEVFPMVILLLVPLMMPFLFLGQTSEISYTDNSLTVVNFKWSPVRRIPKREEVPNMAPPPEMTAGNKNAGRVARINNPQIPDPNEQTIDGRSAAIEKIVQESRVANPKPIDGFLYETRVRNGSTKQIEIVFWEYQFIDQTNTVVARHQFLCGVKIKSNREKDLSVFSLLRPSDVINAATAGDKSPASFRERVLINRIEYSDGSISQRRDWNFAEIKMSYKRAIETPWEGEMCRGL
jgi:hypothetical protein